MREKRSHLKKQAMNSQDNSSDVPVFPRGRVREAFDFLTRRTNYESFKIIPYDQMARSLERLRAALEAFSRSLQSSGKMAQSSPRAFTSLPLAVP